MSFERRSVATAVATVTWLLGASIAAGAQVTVDVENRYPAVGVVMVWRVDEAGKPVELRGFASGTLIRDRVMVTWALWSIPSYVCSGDSGGGIFLTGDRSGDLLLVANVSDGGRDCRRHNNNNRLDTRAIQYWIDDAVRQRS